MNIIVYCQHVLGMGHFFRILEIVKALNRHHVLIVTGGKSVPVLLPAHASLKSLPPLMMDSNFKKLYSDEVHMDLESVKEKRVRMLRTAYEEFSPDFFIIELYPFGRKAFKFELEPLIRDIRQKKIRPSRVVCSLRDILVEKKDPKAYEEQVIEQLNCYFDELIIHSDPRIISLDQTFSRISDIKIPTYYSGFVSPEIHRKNREQIREKLSVNFNERLIVVSCGGGHTGWYLLHSSIKALNRLSISHNIKGIIIGGPFMDENEYLSLYSEKSKSVDVCRFRNDFIDLLSAADLSISMAGYNTIMNIAATGVPALVYPFVQNQEQMMRAVFFSKKNVVDILKDEDLSMDHFEHIILKKLNYKNNVFFADEINLNGAAFVASHIEKR